MIYHIKQLGLIRQKSKKFLLVPLYADHIFFVNCITSTYLFTKSVE